MALIEIDRVVDTVAACIESQKPVYNSLIDTYYQSRRLSVFIGNRNLLPASDLPAIEIQPISEDIDWFAVRVQEENPALDISITTDNGEPEKSLRLQAKLVALTTRILAAPPALRAGIEGTHKHLQDSLPKSVNYGDRADGRMRVARISWTGKILIYLSNEMFDEQLKIPQGIVW